MSNHNQPSFDLQPHLSNDCVTIRPLTIDDYDSLYLAVSDPRTWEQTPYPDRYQSEKYQLWFDEAIKNQALTILDTNSQSAIGSSRFYDINTPKDTVAIGYTFLNHHYWGGTANKAMKSLMLNHAFQHFETVWLHIAETNTRSRKAAEKIGANLSHIGERNALPYCWYSINQSTYDRKNKPD